MTHFRAVTIPKSLKRIQATPSLALKISGVELSLVDTVRV